MKTRKIFEFKISNPQLVHLLIELLRNSDGTMKCRLHLGNNKLTSKFKCTTHEPDPLTLTCMLRTSLDMKWCGDNGCVPWLMILTWCCVRCWITYWWREKLICTHLCDGEHLLDCVRWKVVDRDGLKGYCGMHEGLKCFDSIRNIAVNRVESEVVSVIWCLRMWKWLKYIPGSRAVWRRSCYLQCLWAVRPWWRSICALIFRILSQVRKWPV